MYKRIAAAIAVIILASAIVVFSARELSQVVNNENHEVNIIFQSDKLDK